jgi:hypothetical protein
MSSQSDGPLVGAFGIEGEQGEIIIPSDREDIKAVVKRERVCEVKDSYTRTSLCITSGKLKIKVPLEDQSAVELGELLTKAGKSD